MSSIAVFGGTFDPIHTGHAMMANYLSQLEGIDEVWLMVSRRNPLKEEGGAQDFDHRLRMARLVAEDCVNVKASDFEAGLPQPSYTIRTLEELRKAYPEHRFRWVIGSDNWNIFSRWREADRIISEFGLLVYERPGYPLAGDLPQGVEVVRNAPQVAMSSTFVREAIRKGKKINFFVADKVLKYINDNNLYRQ